MIDDIALPLGRTFDGDLVIDPFPNTSRLVLGSTGAAKTTSVVMPTIQALMANTSLTVFVNDPKDGECFSQILPVAKRYARRVGCMDDMGHFGWDNPDRLILNPFGAIVSAAKHDSGTLLFTIETATHCFIPEVNDGGRNFHFRFNPRLLAHLGILILVEFMPNDVRPGMLYEMMANPDTWRSARENAAIDGSADLKARARLSLDMEENDPDGYYKHMTAALMALQLYAPGSSLNSAGVGETHTHEELCRNGWLVHMVLPQRYAERVGTHFALHQFCMLQAQFSGRGGRVINIVDELCNSPQKDTVKKVTIQRSYRTSSLYIAQTFVDIENQYGEKEAAILRDNCPVVQYLSFSDADAEKVSKAMGDEISVSQSLNVNPERLEISGSISTGQQPVMTATELKNLDPTHQIIHLRGYGWLVCQKLFQNQIIPTAHYLGKNPLEGDPMPVDPKVEFPVPPIEGDSS